MRARLCLLWILFEAAVLPVGAASFTGHAVPVGRGSLGGTLPPPGFYLRDYSVFYVADRYNLASGKRAPIDFKMSVYANVLRGLWVSDRDVLGGKFFMDVSAVAQTASTTLAGVRRTDSGLGDAYVQPFGVGWHGKGWDAGTAYTVWIPTGDSEPRTNKAGKGFWGHMLSAGVTVYLDEKKSWATSVLNRYEINHRERDTRIRPGDQVTVEWGLSKKLQPTVDLGFVGGYQAQTTRDAGPSALRPMDSEFFVGPEVVVVWPSLRMFSTLRYLESLIAKDRPQGRALMWMVSRRF
jgi:hypothetical protein